MLEPKNHYDALIIGGGIAGQETALNLANLGYKVALVEKDYSIGGKMILLSKVFPTLDCAACITTPKVSETARHPNIDIFTYSVVEDINKMGRGFNFTLRQKPRYVTTDCTGCQLCETVCPVVVKDEYQYDLVGRKAIFIPHSIANPRIAAIDLEHCTFCGLCENVCPPQCIDFTQQERVDKLTATTIVLATGYKLFDPTIIKRYGYGRYKNVVTAMQMERQLVPTRPFNTILRPSDGKVPDNIAYILCTGSRDITVGNPICSQVCCMYSTKQAQLLMGALPMADITLYFINIRAFGKGFCEFYQQARGMGVEYVKGKVGRIFEKDNGNLILRYEKIETGEVKETEHDLVVLSIGILPNTDYQKMFKNIQVKHDPYNYVKQTEELISPARTSVSGVFVAGTAAGPMDIPDTILSAGAASSEAASYLRKVYKEIQPSLK